MRARFLLAAALFAASAAGFTGCGSGSPTNAGGGTTRPDPEKKTDIHIRGPKGGTVDIETKEGGGTKVDIRRPGTGKD
jgi:hypothetical protein